jgi:hypothetical protein
MHMLCCYCCHWRRTAKSVVRIRIARLPRVQMASSALELVRHAQVDTALDRSLQASVMLSTDAASDDTSLACRIQQWHQLLRMRKCCKFRAYPEPLPLAVPTPARTVGGVRLMSWFP